MKRAVQAAGGLAALGLGVTAAVAQSTESTFTVPPGEWLVESDVVTWENHRGHEALTYGAGLVSVDGGERWDAQVGYTGWTRVDADRPPGETTYRGDPYVRFKWRLDGEGEARAVALLPGVVIPTGEDRDTVWSLVVPASFGVSREWHVDAQVGAEWGDGSFDSMLGTMSVALHRQVGRATRFYAEGGGTWWEDELGWRANFVGLGVGWALTERFELELGTYALLNDEEELLAVLRLSWSGRLPGSFLL